MNGIFYDGYENVKVSLIDYDKDIAKRNWYALRTTWKELHEVEYNQDDPRCIQMIRDLVQGKVFGTFLSTAHLTYFIQNISRICLAQITRDTGYKWASESNMPNPLSHQITIPKYIYNNKEWMSKLKVIQEKIEELYSLLCEEGVPYQDSRYIGLHGQQISITGTLNMELLQTFCRNRLNNLTHDEINLVYRLMKKSLRDQINKDYKEDSLDSLSYYMWKVAEEKADVGEALHKKTTFFDPLFTCDNKWSRYPHDKESIPQKPMFDFNKLSWKYELEKIYDSGDHSLLLPDEKEMIERWRDINIEPEFKF